MVGDRLMFALPLIIEAFEIEEIAARLERALDDVANELMREGALGCAFSSYHPSHGSSCFRRFTSAAVLPCGPVSGGRRGPLMKHLPRRAALGFRAV